MAADDDGDNDVDREVDDLRRRYEILISPTLTMLRMFPPHDSVHLFLTYRLPIISYSDVRFRRQRESRRDRREQKRQDTRDTLATRCPFNHSFHGRAFQTILSR